MGLCKRKAIITKFERQAEAYSDFGRGEGRMGYDGGNGPRSGAGQYGEGRPSAGGF